MVSVHPLEVVPYEVHPHVALIRDFVGYTVYEQLESSPDDESYLISLDPKDWKTHDYYAILGLKNIRYMASVEEIRTAYRRKLLAHHPDKRRSKGEFVKDESHDYFSCITIAYEILGNPAKRHAYDSIDPIAVDDSVPTLAEIKADYFGTLREFFARKARWSKKQPVPCLGSPGTHIEDVHAFYDFWENYDTIRDYSFLDEEDKEKGEDRETRRAIERQNRAERARRRADELRSVRQIVEMARENDPRLLAAIKAERDLKAAKRQARLDALREKRAAEEQQARLEAEQLAIARAASEERRRDEADRMRREREQVRQEAKRERRRLRAVVVDQYDHFCPTEPRPADFGAERVRILAALDLLCQRLSNVQLQELNTRLEQTTSADEARDLFNAKYHEIQQAMQPPGLQIGTKSSQSDSAEHSITASVRYSPEVIQALIKAVNLLPAGTPKRWEAIAAYINQHVPNASISGKEALKQAKALSHDDAHLRKEANTKAFDAFASSVRESEAVKNVTITSELEADAARPWTVTEQRALEQALRSCSADQMSAPGEDRWQRIANIVGTRTRRECMLRCKELSDQVRAKKAAIAAATKGSIQNGLATAPTKPSGASRSKPT
ncbi:hypothetical protein EG68_09376 [Paragonimus skrjabini miyazakii]|uniref:DnaJ homolog subfamily C member 2 n=1 Tax=Paragonimus skrjabini miyazakii TaxID=59628 RepID=A0A8S9YDE8_9TREM|nr:hypothetical protein EG68_09376 [Paragonimus skrjabini miyazakii]